MKKLFLSVAVLAAVAISSCSTSEKKAEDEGAAIKAKIENCTNPDSLKVYIQQAKDYADKLVKDGNDAAAKAYLDEVKPAVEAKDAAAAGFFNSLSQEADSAVAATKAAADSLKAKTENAKDAVSDAASSAADAAKDKASEVGDKASDVYNNAKDKTVDVYNNAKDKTVDAVKSGADKVKGALEK